MTIERQFLDWNQPLLPQAANWLWKFGEARADESASGARVSGQVCDLSNVIVVVPGARAGGRVLELLVDRADLSAQTVDLLPPKIQTVGTLPEMLYTAKRPFAPPVVQRMAWVAAIRQLSEADLKQLVSDPPSFDRSDYWLEIGELLARLSRELATDILDFEDVLETGKTLSSFPEVDRWSILRKIQQAYLQQLDSLGLWDRQTARRVAIKMGAEELHSDAEIVLLGTVDLSRAVRAMLDTLAGRTKIHCLVFGDQTRGEAFDSHGCIQVDYWQERRLAVPQSDIRLVDGPMDQAAAVVQQVAAFGDELELDDLTIAVPDRSVLSGLQRRFDEVDQPSRWLGGRSIGESLPFRMLAGIAAYLERGKYAEFVALVRHPSLKGWLERGAPDDGWLEQLDRYQNERLPLRFDQRAVKKEPRLRDAREPVLTGLTERLDGLITPLSAPSDITEQWEAVRNLLAVVYAEVEVDRDSADGRFLYSSLKTINQAIDELSAVPAEIAIQLSPSEKLRLLLDHVSSTTIVMPHQFGELELSGWLDAPWEDTSRAVICGFNEGVVPSSEPSDLFLPDRLRTALGLLDNARRYARDSYALALLLHSKRELQLIVGKRDMEGNPLSPSRLLFAVPNDEIGPRAKELFKTPDPVGWFQETSAGNMNETYLRVPRPVKSDAIISELSVTRFSSYLACPYRFYLSEVVGLESLDDRVDEVPSNIFGNLMHDILEAFGKSDLRHSSEEEVISEFVLEQLDRGASYRFSRSALPTVAIQMQQLRRRLLAFATVQSERCRAGWRIWETEIKSLRHELSVDGEPFTIKGRIDRIDVHEETGTYALLDYKSSESVKTPDKSHRNDQEWTNLQLPLYRLLAQEIPEIEGQVELGFFVLPKDVSKVDVLVANWTAADFAKADETAHDVIRALRQQIFWPPADYPSRWDDPFAGVCQVGIIDQHPEDVPTDNPFDAVRQYLADQAAN